jgi:hypothetical protein
MKFNCERFPKVQDVDWICLARDYYVGTGSDYINSVSRNFKVLNHRCVLT